MSGAVLKFDPNAMSEAEAAEAMDRLRGKMMRDAEGVWNSLVALARYGPDGFSDPATQLAAQKLVLAYTLGEPVARQEINVRNSGKPTNAPPLEAMSDDELRALKVLRDAQRRRKLESGDG